MSDYPLLIHIGYPKAGSSWLQHAIFKQNETGFADPWGVNDPNDPGSGGSGEAVEQFIIANAFRFSAKSAHKVFEPGLQEAVENGLVPVLSHEGLAGNQIRGKYWGKEVADRLHATFPEAQILIFIREQKSMIKSSYGQYIKGGDVATIQRYIGIGGTLKTGLGPICQLDYLEYDLLIQYYQNLFGINNVLALPLELLKLEGPQTVIQRIISFANAKGKPGELLLPLKNRGLQGAMFTIRRNFNVFCAPVNSYGSKVPLTWSINNKISPFVQKLIPQLIHKKMEQRLEQTIAEGVGDFFRASNQRTSQLIGINLAQLGYNC